VDDIDDPLIISPTDLTHPDAQTLIAELDADLIDRYPDPADRHFELLPEQVTGDRGVFLVARAWGVPFGCAALRVLEPGADGGPTDGTPAGEIKRMYAVPRARGIGVGRALLEELERHARRLGVGRLGLETGEHQHEALALYDRAGFARIAPFGEYVHSPRSICLAKPLS
jgi:putative acetyltransferase